MAFETQRQYQEAGTHSASNALSTVAAVRRDVNTSSVANGQYEALHTNATGRLKVSTHNGGFDPVTGTITAVAQTVAADVSQAGSATVTVAGTHAGVNLTFEAYDGVNWVGLWAQQTDVQSVVLVSGVITTNATRAWDVSPLLGFSQLRVRATAWTSGTANIRIIPAVQSPELAPYITGAVSVSSGTVTTVTTLTGGGVASGAADSGNPLKVGAVARTTNPTAVADAQRVNFIADKLGKQVVVGSIREQKVQQNTTITTSTAETTILTAVAATFLDVYGLIIANTSATVCTVTIKDSTAGTTRFVFTVPAGDTRCFTVPESAAHSQATVNTNWTATCSASVSSIVITALAIKNL